MDNIEFYQFLKKMIKGKMKYISIGICVLIICVFAGKKITVDVFNEFLAQDERRLPIYCVNTDEKKVSISFDAA